MIENELFKYRSVTACMKASYDLISGNILSLLKKTWWAVLIYAILMSLTTYFQMPNKALHDWGEANPWSSYIIQTLVYLGALLGVFLAGASIWSWLNKMSFKKNLVRYFSTFVWVEVLVFVLSGISSFLLQAVSGGKPLQPGDLSTSALLTSLGALGIYFGFLIVYLLLALPFTYLVPKNMLRKNGEKLEPWKSFKIGFRNIGNSFAISFLCGLMLAVIIAFLLLPVAILGWSQISAQLGALEGDPLGVPGYFNALFLLVLTITFFIIIYIGTWMLFSYVYLYGSIVAKEKKLGEENRMEIEYKKQQEIVYNTNK